MTIPLDEALSQDHPERDSLVGKFRTVDDLATQAASLRRELTQRSETHIPIEPQERNDAYMKRLRQANQAPETLEDYGLPEGSESLASVLEAIRPVAHGSALSRVGWEKLSSTLVEALEGERATQEAAAKKSQEEAQEALRKEWGDSYEERMAVVERLGGRMAKAHPELAQALEETGMAKRPEWTQFLATMAQSASEDDLPGGGSPHGDGEVGLQQAREKFSELRKLVASTEFTAFQTLDPELQRKREEAHKKFDRLTRELREAGYEDPMHDPRLKEEAQAPK